MAKPKKHITDLNGVEYECGKILGSGGQGSVRSVTNLQDGKEYALKMYRPADATYQLRQNIERLVEISRNQGGFRDKKKQVLSYVILPLAIVEGKNGAFGYIMEKVDLDNYTTMIPSWVKPEKRPSLDVICKIVKELCRFYHALHLSNGLCYKDLNEGNIYFNWKTGDICIIDNDNIAESKVETVKGTARYIAPEVVTGDCPPDSHSDVFSLAVFIYRLMIGGFPFEGKFVADYCQNNNIGLDDAIKKLLGTDALYVWNSTDTRNSIEGFNETIWDNQAAAYHGLSPKIQDALRDTFEVNLPFGRRAERFSAESWYNLFDELEKELVPCPHGEDGLSFADTHICYACHRSLTSEPVLTVKIVSAGDASVIKEIRPKELYKGSDISGHLDPGNLFTTGYSKSKKLFMIMNVSKEPWAIHYDDGTVKQCDPQKQVYVKADRIISFKAKKVNMKFVKQTD